MAIPAHTSEAELSHLAQQQPALHSQIANHPQVSTALLQWIAQHSPDAQARAAAAGRLQATGVDAPVAQPGPANANDGQPPQQPGGQQPGGQQQGRSSRRALLLTILATLVVAALALTATELTGVTHLVRKESAPTPPATAAASTAPSPSASASQTPTAPATTATSTPPRGAGGELTVAKPADGEGSFARLTYQQAEKIDAKLPASAQFDANSNAFTDGKQLFVLTADGAKKVPLDEDVAEIRALHSAIAATVTEDAHQLRLIDVQSGSELGTYSANEGETINAVVISSPEHIVLEVAKPGGKMDLVGIDGGGTQVWRDENLDFHLGCPGGSEVNIENGVRYLHGERDCKRMVDSQTGKVTTRESGVIAGQYDGAVVVYDANRVIIYDGEMKTELASYKVPRKQLLSPAGWKDYAGRSPHLADTITLADLKAGLASLQQAPPATNFYGVTSGGVITSLDTISGGTVIWRGQRYQCDEGVDFIDGGAQMLCYNASGVMDIFEAELTATGASYRGVQVGSALHRFNGASWVLRSETGDYLLEGN